ncbi:MAG: hypothetical protein KF757_06215 [Phycisphaeraceae bacterium]|nr:hypothetical protein [Phycisphaeraceae bacterium]MCW5764329.1 hypothetical protein [Phycisphaeraceae bacterium]
MSLFFSDNHDETAAWTGDFAKIPLGSNFALNFDSGALGTYHIKTQGLYYTIIYAIPGIVLVGFAIYAFLTRSNTESFSTFLSLCALGMAGVIYGGLQYLCYDDLVFDFQANILTWKRRTLRGRSEFFSQLEDVVIFPCRFINVKSGFKPIVGMAVVVSGRPNLALLFATRRSDALKRYCDHLPSEVQPLIKNDETMPGVFVSRMCGLYF